MESVQTQHAPASLCAPTAELTCFGCCPPIRPHHYDCLDYVGSLKREFSENRLHFLRRGPEPRPIVGYHCWALGFLDERGRQVGCLLHPSRNNGRDLRSLIDYGNKCERESCNAARQFNLLPPEGQLFWLPLVQGLSPFHFSSPRSNPLFHLLLWGREVLEPLRLQAESAGWTETELLFHHPFLLDSTWVPQAHRYLFRLIMETVGSQGKAEPRLDEPVQKLLNSIHAPLEATPPDMTPPDADWYFTHQLPLDEDFLDFLRLDLGWRKVRFEEAARLKNNLEKMSREVLPAF